VFQHSDLRRTALSKMGFITKVEFFEPMTADKR